MKTPDISDAIVAFMRADWPNQTPIVMRAARKPTPTQRVRELEADIARIACHLSGVGGVHAETTNTIQMVRAIQLLRRAHTSTQ